MSETSILNVYVTRMGGYYGDITCSYKTGGGTAVPAVNYLTGAGDLMWKEGDMTAKTFPVTIIDDGEWAEVNLWFTASLSNLIDTYSAAAFELDETTIEIINKNPKIPGTMSFVSGAYSVAENTPGTVTLYISRSGGWDGAASVRCRTSNGTAIAGMSADYNFKDETLTWTHHESGSKPFTVTIHDNAQWVAIDKYFTCSLSTGVGAIIGTLSRSIVTIIDDEVYSPGTMSFVTGAYSVNENDGMVTLYVTRSGGTDLGASIVCMTQDGTALAGTHYTYTIAGLSWADGEHVAKPVNVPITNTPYWDINRNFTASLFGEYLGARGTLSRSIVTIVNSIPYTPGTTSFVLAEDSIAETDGPLTVYVQRTGGSSGTASVQYTASNGTAINPTNYQLTTGILNWTANDSANKSFPITINVDGVYTGDIKFTASLHKPTSSMLGTVSQSIITIIDTDLGDPGVLSFVTAAYSINEPDGNPDTTDTLTMEVQRVGGTYGQSTVVYTTTDVTARDGISDPVGWLNASYGQDYVAASNTLTWTNGDATNKSFDIQILRNTRVTFAKVDEDDIKERFIDGVWVGYSFYGVTGTPNGDIYVVEYGVGIYKQTGGTGNFTLTYSDSTYYQWVAAAPNGDVYAVAPAALPDSLRIKPAASGAFSVIANPSVHVWTGVAVDQYGNVYACTSANDGYEGYGGGDIYMQTSGAGEFVPLNTYPSSWRGMAVSNNGDIYAIISSTSNMFLRRSGELTFNEIVGTSGGWTNVVRDPNSTKVYACQNDGQIYEISGRTSADFKLLSLEYPLQWAGMGVAYNGDVYATVYNGLLFKMTGLDKEFTVGLSGVTNSTLGSPDTTTATIVNVI